MGSLENWENEAIIQFNCARILIIMSCLLINLLDKPLFNRKSKMTEVLPITDRDCFIANFIEVLIKIGTIILSIGLLFSFKVGDEMPGLRGILILYSMILVYLVTKRNIYKNLDKDTKKIKVVSRVLSIILILLTIVVIIVDRVSSSVVYKY